MSDKTEFSVNEYDNCVSDLLVCHNVKLMSDFVQHGRISCLDHCMDVSYYSYIVCKKLRLDYIAAARGGLLHDYFLYDWHNSPYRLHGIRHPRLALINASNDFELNVIECDIIKKHMWPLTLVPPRYAESFVVSFVDKYCTIKEVLRLKKEKVTS